MNPFRSLCAPLLAATLVACTLVLAACGGGGGSGSGDDATAATVQVDSSRTTRTTLGTAGGTVSATAADGRVYTLTVPAGALTANTEISAAPVGSMGAAPLAAGVKGAVRFAPAGLKFALPAMLRIEGASTTVATGKRLVGFLRSDDGGTMSLVPLAQAAGALELPVLHFSDAGAAEATPAELAAIPIPPTTDPVQDLWDTAMREAGATDDDTSAMLIRLHDQKLSPLLTTMAGLADDDRAQNAQRESAVATWAAWVRIVDLSGVPVVRLGDRMALARARAGALLLTQVDRGRADCLAPLPLDITHLRGLLRALGAQKVAQQHGLDAQDLGLDADTVGRRMNDCARVAFVPRPVPALETGRAVSLDAQAELLFAANPNDKPPVDFVFEVSSADADIANPRGNSNASGQYTTVVTPRIANAVFEVKACLITFMANGTPVVSAMCARQTVSERTRPVFAGTVAFFFGVPLSKIGEARLRLQAEPDGSYTVLEASGATSYTNTRVIATCHPVTPGLPNVHNVPISTSGVSTITGGRQLPGLAAGQFIHFQLTGATTNTFDELDAACRVTTRVTNSTSAGGMQILRVENDAQGAPAVLVIGDRNGSFEGRLVREQ